MYVCKHMRKSDAQTLPYENSFSFCQYSLWNKLYKNTSHFSLQELHSKPSTEQEECPNIHICSIPALRNLQSKLANVILDRDIVWVVDLPLPSIP